MWSSALEDNKELLRLLDQERESKGLGSGLNDIRALSVELQNLKMELDREK